MSLYHVIGSEFVPQDAPRERRHESMLESVSLPLPSAEPIGTGKPLSIIVRHLLYRRFQKVRYSPPRARTCL